jgi:acetoacetate decarboxylase
MREHEVLERAFAMPLTSPAYPRGVIVGNSIRLVSAVESGDALG